jgi:predicted nucleotidyltransferase
MSDFRHKSLPLNQQAFVSEMVDALTKIKGVEAIVLGGSHARGVAIADSDVDLGIYYSDKSSPLIDEMQKLAKRFDSNAVVTYGV